jgi:predicted transcriptional regulator
VRPMDIGGRDASYHSATLKKLVEKGLVERKRRNSLMNALGSTRGSYVYRRRPTKEKAE